MSILLKETHNNAYHDDGTILTVSDSEDAVRNNRHLVHRKHAHDLVAQGKAEWLSEPKEPAKEQAKPTEEPAKPAKERKYDGDQALHSTDRGSLFTP